jgi:hypothetical protein
MIVGTSRLDCSQVAWSNIKLVNYLWPIIDRNHLVKRCKTRSHVKHGLLWLDCDSQIRTKLPNLWGIFDRILKNGLFDAQSFRFKKESFWLQKSRPWCRSAEAHGSVDTATATSKALVCNSLKCSGIMANLGCIHFLWLGLLPQGHAHACGYCAEGPYSLTNWPMCSSDGVAFVWAKCNMTVGLPLVFLLSSWNDSCIHRVPFLPTSAYYVA